MLWTHLERKCCYLSKVLPSLLLRRDLTFVNVIFIVFQGPPLETYHYCRALEHDPVREPLKMWLVTEIMKSSQLFFHHDGMLDIGKMLESDLLYELWGFLKTMANGSKISAEG